MGIELRTKPGTIPYDLILTLRCDGTHKHPVTFSFQGSDYTKMFHDAMSAGWKETYIDLYASGLTRCFLCPLCSGKVRS